MHIPPSSAASAAAGSVSQATSKDRSSGGVQDAAHLASATQIERVARSEASSADRDAQGGGQGLGAHGQQPGHEEPMPASTPTADDMLVVPPEPPSELDIVG